MRPTPLEIAVAGDSGDERAENERRDDYCNEAEKNVAEDAQVLGDVRPVETNFAAGEHGEENPVGQGGFSKTAQGEEGETQPADQRRQAGGNRKERADEEEAEADECKDAQGWLAAFFVEVIRACWVHSWPPSAFFPRQCAAR